MTGVGTTAFASPVSLMGQRRQFTLGSSFTTLAPAGAGYQDFRFALDDDHMVASSPVGTAVFVRKGDTWIHSKCSSIRISVN
jgi:hypothetical protein